MIAVGGLAVLILVVVTGALASLQLKPAQSFSVDQTDVQRPVAQSLSFPPMQWQDVIVWAGLFLAAAALLFMLSNREQRKKLLILVFRLGIIVAAVLLVLNHFNDRILQQDLQDGLQQSTHSGANVVPAAVPPFVPPAFPPWAIYLISLGILGTVGGLVWLGIWLYRRRKTDPPLEELAAIARTTLKVVQSGEDWQDAIVQCYLRMSAVVGVRRNLARPAAVTPSEFALQLEAAGLPGEAVGRLTRLFERVRYGAKKSGRKEIDEAVECLQIILHACKEAL